MSTKGSYIQRRSRGPVLRRSRSENDCPMNNQADCGELISVRRRTKNGTNSRDSGASDPKQPLIQNFFRATGNSQTCYIPC